MIEGSRRPRSRSPHKPTSERPSMGTTETLARWIADTKYEQIPPGAIEQAKKSILDYIGTATYGTTSELGKIMLEFTREQGGNPQARVLGTNIRTASTQAAFANGTTGHSEDFDDLGGCGGHPATVLTPTVLALADELHLSGQEVLTAWVVGYELGTRLSANNHTDRDWHPTAIYGTMAAAAAASKALKLDAEKVRMALGIAGSEAAGLRRNFGTMTKPFHPGQAARNGIIAAKLAAKGFTSDPDIIEGRQGYADNFGGAKCNVPEMTKFLGKVYYLEEEGTRIKPWPCCGGNHQTLTNLLPFIKEKKLKADDVESVEHIGPNIPCTGALLRTEVHAGLEGKFSLAYNISAAFIDGKVDYGTFTNERAAKGDLQAFMKRVKLVRNNDVVLRRPHIADGNPEARLRITMKNGTVHEFVMQKATHLTGDAVVDKFRMNTEKILGKEKAGSAIELVQRLEKVKDVAQLIDAVTLA
ncbi:MAG: MmgE/PrpD family protein [Betaproteobacteria bacterium]|nr:MAG: MmgE/PrpD family protein [Betaproteobacteria bacterium]